MRKQTSAADFGSCLGVVQQLGQALRTVRDASPENKEFEFIELLNLMEALATLVNDGRPASSTNKVAAHFIEETLSWVAITPGMSALMRQSTTGDGTYGELQKFQDRRAAAIRRTAKHYRDKRDTAPLPSFPSRP